jgi:hypothetical protein
MPDVPVIVLAPSPALTVVFTEVKTMVSAAALPKIVSSAPRLTTSSDMFILSAQEA